MSLTKRGNPYIQEFERRYNEIWGDENYEYERFIQGLRDRQEGLRETPEKETRGNNERPRANSKIVKQDLANKKS